MIRCYLLLKASCYAQYDKLVFEISFSQPVNYQEKPEVLTCFFPGSFKRCEQHVGGARSFHLTPHSLHLTLITPHYFSLD